MITQRILVLRDHRPARPTCHSHVFTMNARRFQRTHLLCGMGTQFDASTDHGTVQMAQAPIARPNFPMCALLATH